MIYDIAYLKNNEIDFDKVNAEIKALLKEKKLTRIKRGLYSNNVKIDAPIIANKCYGPSYISFEYALAYYDLIPEYVYRITNATYGKNKIKEFDSKELSLIYKPIPKKAFNIGVRRIKNEEGKYFRIASKEKAICDELYSMYPTRSMKDFKLLMFDNLRMEEEDIKTLNLKLLLRICKKYKSNNLYMFIKYIKKELMKE